MKPIRTLQSDHIQERYMQFLLHLSKIFLVHVNLSSTKLIIVVNYSFEIKDFSEKKLNATKDHIGTAASQRQTALFYYYKRIR